MSVLFVAHCRSAWPQNARPPDEPREITWRMRRRICEGGHMTCVYRNTHTHTHKSDRRASSGDKMRTRIDRIIRQQLIFWHNYRPLCIWAVLFKSPEGVCVLHFFGAAIDGARTQVLWPNGSAWCLAISVPAASEEHLRTSATRITSVARVTIGQQHTTPHQQAIR